MWLPQLINKKQFKRIYEKIKDMGMEIVAVREQNK